MILSGSSGKAAARSGDPELVLKGAWSCGGVPNRRFGKSRRNAWPLAHRGLHASQLGSRQELCSSRLERTVCRGSFLSGLVGGLKWVKLLNTPTDELVVHHALRSLLCTLPPVCSKSSNTKTKTLEDDLGEQPVGILRCLASAEAVQGPSPGTLGLPGPQALLFFTTLPTIRMSCLSLRLGGRTAVLRKLCTATKAL
jgi:hypothetical protein